MNRDNRTLLLVLGGVALVFVCICLAVGATVIAGVRLTASGTAATPVSQAATVDAPSPTAAVEPSAEPTFPVATLTAIPTSTPVAIPTTPTEALQGPPTPESESSTEALTNIDFDVFREAWGVLAQEYDGPLPSPEELHDNTVRCSVENGLGETGYADWEAQLDSTLAEQNTTATSFDEIDFAAYDAVWQKIADAYEGELPTRDELRELTIGCSVADSLEDPNTRYLPERAVARMREDLTGSFEGIGAFVRMNEANILEIARPMDGQPAEQVGLLAGDQVIGVDGENMIGLMIDEIISRIRGPRGSMVVLTIQRPGVEQPFDVTIIRAQIVIPLVESELLEQGIAYVRLSQFSRNATSQLLTAFAELLPQAPNGLIFDVRDDPGGFLSEAISVSDLFLDGGVVARERNRAGLDEEFSADAGDPAETVPLVILVNAGSASASEIVAGAVQDYGRGVIIGETTFGKGSVQLPYTLSDGGELRVTIARWYTPNNTSIDGRGITPDIEVPSPEDLTGPDDGQLNRAIEYLLNGR